MISPKMPAEWAFHDAVWIGFPHLVSEWTRGVGQSESSGSISPLDEARREIAAFANAVHDGGRGEEVRLLVRDEANVDLAAALVDPGVKLLIRRFGDIWLRDTGAIIIGRASSRIACHFRFNGWGGKFVLPGDQEIGARLAVDSGLPVQAFDWVLEGGGVDVDGAGLGVTTRQYLLNPNRNPCLSRRQIEAHLADALGIERLLWLDNGLVGDHTDGHVDNLARFVGEARLALPLASGKDDPNAAVYDDARRRARDFDVEIVDIPSPGRVHISEPSQTSERGGEPAPASYMNFYISNTAVIVPTYGVVNDRAAVEALAALFPTRKTLGIPARSILAGGGSFHCSSQQIPA